MMEQPIQERRREGTVVVEDFRPMLVGTVAGDDQGATLIAFADDLEEQIGTVLVDGKVAKFVDHEQSRLQILAQFTLEAALRLGGGERVDDIDGGGEQHRVAAQARGVRQRDREMTFAQADVGNEDHVALVLDEAQSEEILNLGSVDFSRPAPLERIEGLDHRKAGQPHPSLDTAVFAGMRLAFDQSRQIVDVRPLLGARLLRQGLKAFEQMGQFEARQLAA